MLSVGCLEYFCIILWILVAGYGANLQKAFGRDDDCRNPILAKCAGEAQQLQSWGFVVLQDSRMFRARQQGPKHLALGCSWCHWKGLET